MRLCDENETFTRTLKTHLFVIFENEFTLAIWFEEPLWSAVECYRHGLWRYVNLVNLNPQPTLPTHICITRHQWVKTEKDNEMTIPGRFSKQIGISIVQSTREILCFGVILSKALELIYGAYFRFQKSWYHQHFNWLSYSLGSSHEGSGRHPRQHERRTIGHLFYATSTFLHHFVANSEFKLELQSTNGLLGSKSAIFF